MKNARIGSAGGQPDTIEVSVNGGVDDGVSPVQTLFR
jgi:hypothetical protein